MDTLTIDFTKRLYPDINHYSRLPPEYSDYGRFAITHRGDLCCAGISSYPPNTRDGFYWARSGNTLYISLRGSSRGFLERENGVPRESSDIRVYTDYFTSKLLWETEVLYELRHEKSMNNFYSKYYEWLCDKLLTPEVVGRKFLLIGI